MEKSDFKIGRWYTSSKFEDTIAFKISGFNGRGHPLPSEKVRSNGVHKFSSNGAYCQPIKTFREVHISEIKKYLPKDHPDLQTLIEEDDQFPLEGCCYKDPDIYEHLKSLGILPQRKEDSCYNEDDNITYLSWYKWGNERRFSFMSRPDTYTTWLGQENLLNKIQKTKENGNSKRNTSSTSIEIHRTPPEDRQPVGAGAIAIRCRGQQITTGNRPQGHPARARCTTTYSRTIEIRKNIIQRENS